MHFIQKPNPARIINSLLAGDFYKFPMLFLIWLMHRQTQVVFELMNRTKTVLLADIIPEHRLREELDHAMTLRMTRPEAQYIAGVYQYDRMMFNALFAQYLLTIQLPQYELTKENGQYRLKFSGPWDMVTLWETIALPIINELYVEALMKDLSFGEKREVWAQGHIRLMDKVRLLKANPNVSFSDFGTRRRAAGWWQRQICEVLMNELPPSQFRGTSSTEYAMQLGLDPMGTNAHEMPMGYQGIFFDLDETATPDQMLPSQLRFLQDWWTVYGKGLSMFLPDTYGSEYFFNHLPQNMLHDWNGSRQDSGVPSDYIEKRIQQYRRFGIDPKTKLIVPSDGLTVPKMIDLTNAYGDQVKVSHGLGTHLTFDLPGFQTVSIVCKMTEAAGRKVVKLSDNRNKATGDPDAVARMKRLVGYDLQFSEQPVV